MIGKVLRARKKGKGNFRDLINYIVGDRGEKKETNRAIHVGTRNVFSDTSENYWAVALEMSGLGLSNTRIKDPVFHFVLSFRPNETPTEAQVDEAVDISLRALGLQNCKTLYGLQTDNGIHHIHVCVCKVDPETGAAINPGDGWSIKALMKAAREIESVQGWEVLNDDPHWEVKNGKVIQKPHRERIIPALRNEAQDLEAHMGEKSAQRLAIEQAAGIIREARTWKELHEKLHSAGFEYRKKGSGAVIAVNDVLVKASDVGRDCSLSQLENRIGGYTEKSSIFSAFSEGAETERSLRTKTTRTTKTRNEEGKKNRTKPTKQTAITSKTLNSWQRYQLYRETFKHKKAERTAFFTRRKSEWEELKKEHKRQRDEIFSRSWKGQGKLLNQERMIVASRQLRDRILLREKQRQEQSGFPPPEKFLSYRKWLAENEPERIKDLRNWKAIQKDQEQEMKHPTESKGATTMAKSKEPEKPQESLQFSDLGTDKTYVAPLKPETIPNDDEDTKLKYDLPSPSFSLLKENELYARMPGTPEEAGEKKTTGMEKYQLIKNDDGSLAYSLYGESIAFIEKKDAVEVVKVDESSLLAAMQVAQNKWGAVKVDGSKEHLDICAKLAVEHQIKLHFPKEYLQEIQEKETKARSNDEIRERVESGTATAADMKNLREQIIQNCDKKDILWKESHKIMLSLQREADDYLVSKRIGREMLEILEQSIEEPRPKKSRRRAAAESLGR